MSDLYPIGTRLQATADMPDWNLVAGDIVTKIARDDGTVLYYKESNQDIAIGDDSVESSPNFIPC